MNNQSKAVQQPLSSSGQQANPTENIPNECVELFISGLARTVEHKQGLAQHLEAVIYVAFHQNDAALPSYSCTCSILHEISFHIKYGHLIWNRVWVFRLQ